MGKFNVECKLIKKNDAGVTTTYTKMVTENVRDYLNVFLAAQDDAEVDFLTIRAIKEKPPKPEKKVPGKEVK